jgi:arsenate reductase
MQFHRNELFLICDPQSNVGKQTKALALDICSHINEIDVVRERISPTYWKEIVNILGVHPRELLNSDHPQYKEKMKADNYTMDGWLGVLAHEGHLVKYPIVVFNQTGVVCRTPTDIMKVKQKHDKVLPHLKQAKDRL